MECRQTLECGREYGLCSSVAVQGDVVCVGVNGRVRLFSKASGAQVRELGSNEIAGDVLGVAFIDENTIVVAANRTLRMYTTNNGRFVCSFNSGEAQFAPRGLTVGPDGHIFVCDWGNHCVCVFNVDGTLLYSFDSEGRRVRHFNWHAWGGEGLRFRFRPNDVCMVEGLLFISDANSSRIRVHSVEGVFMSEFNTPWKQCCVAATLCDNLVVSSHESNKFVIMTPNGVQVHEYGGRGDGLGQFWSPQGVAVDNQGRVYVCDWGNHRVQVWDR